MEVLDDDAVRTAYEQYYPKLVGYFFARGCEREESRDLAQDTFLRVYQRRKQFRAESSFRTWMYSIAHSILLNDVRRGKAAMRAAETIPLLDDADPVFASAVLADVPASPEERAQAAELDRILTEAIDRLTPRPRQCARLARSGMTYEQIGAALGITANTVKYHMTKARQQLGELRLELLLSADRERS